MAAKRDYYEILGISKNASFEEIKKAYKDLAKKYHPDVSKDLNATERFKEISEAYAVLSDSQKKTAYDRFGHDGFDQRYTQEDIFRGFDSDIFRDIFGSRFSDADNIFEMFFGSRQGHRERERRGSDLRYDLEITLKEAAFGTKKTFSITKKSQCETCSGSGSKDGKTETCNICDGHGVVMKTARIAFGTFSTTSTCNKCHGSGRIIKHTCSSCNGRGIENLKKDIEVNIPPGVDTGFHLRLKNEGEAIKDGGPGDLYVVIGVEENEFFKRQENDLYVGIPITFSQAAIGAKIEVPTLDGNVEMKIPPGTQSGTLFRLKGKGIKYVNHNEHGDQYVQVKIITPTKTSKKQQELFKQLEKEEENSQKSFFQRIKDSLR